MAKQDDGWSRKDIWKKYGEGFCVEISRHSESGNDYEGVNRWCVYAYIYPTHPHFKAFSGDSIYQNAASCIPFHSGPSLVRWHADETGKIGSVQVGADYHHIHDSHYTFYDNAEQAGSVFFDANELYEWLANYSSEE